MVASLDASVRVATLVEPDGDTASVPMLVANEQMNE